MMHAVCCPVLRPMGADLDGKQRVESEKAVAAGMPQGDAPRRPPDRREFCLPSVKELAKQFATEERRGSESKHKGHPWPVEVAREAEVDYSTVPVSEIINALQQAAEPAARDGRRHKLYDRSRPRTLMEVCRRAGESNTVVAHMTENGSAGEGAARCGGKQVHSLTARSISREFREGLKSGSCRREAASSGGESERGDVVCCGGKVSPTPSVDLKNMKKFWEEIIISNSNSTKQK